MTTATTPEVVLDTNVLVSAALSDGKPYEVLSLAEDRRIISVTSEPILAELSDVLTRDRLPFTDEQVADLTAKIISISSVVDPQISLEVIDDDPDDDKILEAAVVGEVDYIISGDSHLLDLDTYGDIEIRNPAQFLAEIHV
jgi:putative PIN family toxin of toxin-antitoxin system